MTNGNVTSPAISPVSVTSLGSGGIFDKFLAEQAAGSPSESANKKSLAGALDFSD